MHHFQYRDGALFAADVDLTALAGKVKAQTPAAELGLCPPATLVAAMAAALKGTGIGDGRPE